MISTHTATCEFLRQFWQAVLPPPATVSSSHILNQSTPTEKAAKAEKMVRYLGGTEGKVDGVVEQAKAKEASGEKVMIVSFSLLWSLAVGHALFKWKG
jgi:transcription initiation factor TFIIH subunit 1